MTASEKSIHRYLRYHNKSFKLDLLTVKDCAPLVGVCFFVFCYGFPVQNEVCTQSSENVRLSNYKITASDVFCRGCHKKPNGYDDITSRECVFVGFVCVGIFLVGIKRFLNSITPLPGSP